MDYSPWFRSNCFCSCKCTFKWMSDKHTSFKGPTSESSDSVASLVRARKLASGSVEGGGGGERGCCGVAALFLVRTGEGSVEGGHWGVGTLRLREENEIFNFYRIETHPLQACTPQSACSSSPTDPLTHRLSVSLRPSFRNGWTLL